MDSVVHAYNPGVPIISAFGKWAQDEKENTRETNKCLILLQLAVEHTDFR